jgi:hypothetical protein
MKRFLAAALVLWAGAALAQVSNFPQSGLGPGGTPTFGGLLVTGVFQTTTNFAGVGEPGIWTLAPGGAGKAGLNIGRAVASAGDYADFRCFRRANYTGGNNGNFASCFHSDTIVSAGALDSENNVVFSLDNSATAANGSLNAALYVKSIKRSTGATWGTTIEFDDLLADPTTAGVTTEFDMFANTTDANGRRWIIDLVAGKVPGGTGVAPVVDVGMHIGAQFATAGNATINKGIEFGPTTWGTGLIVAKSGITFPQGIDLSAGTCSTNCFKSSGFSVDGSGNTIISNTTNSNNLSVIANANSAGIRLQNTQAGGRDYSIKSSGGSSSFPSSFIVNDTTGSVNFLVANSTIDVGIGSAITDNSLTGAALILTNSTKLATFGGGITNTHLSTGTNADFLCLSAAGVFLLQGSACTISSMRFKNLIGDYKRGGALDAIAHLQPIVFTMKPGERPNPDKNYERPQIGLSAENVAAIEPRCAVYEDDGTTPKSYRQECLIAVLVAAVQSQQREIEVLKAR